MDLCFSSSYLFILSSSELRPRPQTASIYHSDFLNPPVELSAEAAAKRKSSLAKFNEMFGND